VKTMKVSTCPSCSSQILKESLGGGNVRSWCQRCGWASVENATGQQLLTGEQGSVPSLVPVPPNLLVEG